MQLCQSDFPFIRKVPTNMTVYKLDQLEPQIHQSAYISPGAHVIGQVTLEEMASVWFGTTIRADNAPIHIGKRSNIQENSVLHVDPSMPLTVGDDVTVGHQAMLHGCTIGDGSLVGIQAVVLNGARIGKGCLVGAGALVTEGKEFPDGVLIIGSPAKVARELTDKDVERLRKHVHELRTREHELAEQDARTHAHEIVRQHVLPHLEHVDEAHIKEMIEKHVVPHAQKLDLEGLEKRVREAVREHRDSKTDVRELHRELIRSVHEEKREPVETAEKKRRTVI